MGDSERGARSSGRPGRSHHVRTSRAELDAAATPLYTRRLYDTFVKHPETDHVFQIDVRADAPGMVLKPWSERKATAARLFPASRRSWDRSQGMRRRALPASAAARSLPGSRCIRHPDDRALEKLNVVASALAQEAQKSGMFPSDHRSVDLPQSYGLVIDGSCRFFRFLRKRRGNHVQLFEGLVRLMTNCTGNPKAPGSGGGWKSGRAKSCDLSQLCVTPGNRRAAVALRSLQGLSTIPATSVRNVDLEHMIRLGCFTKVSLPRACIAGVAAASSSAAACADMMRTPWSFRRSEAPLSLSPIEK